MDLRDALIDSVCEKLGINVQVGAGSLYIKEGEAYKEFTSDDFEAMFGFLKGDVEIVDTPIPYSQRRVEIRYKPGFNEDTYSTLLQYAS